MSAIAGFHGSGRPEWVDAMLAAVSYRGDSVDVVHAAGASLGVRWWAGRPGKAPGVYAADDGALVACAGTLAPAVHNPAQTLDTRLRSGDFSELDGAFAAARWDGRALTLLRDPFGVRSLYYAEHAGCLLFASELKMLLAVPGLARAVNAQALHAYLTFSFVPGELTPIEGIRRLLPGRELRVSAQGRANTPWFALKEEVDPALNDIQAAVRAVRTEAKAAVSRRLNGEAAVGLFLSGGIDSSAVGRWLKFAEQQTVAFSLDFGEQSVEKEQARAVAESLGIEHQWVPATGERVGAVVDELVHLLDLPFGDAVTGPQMLLAQAAKARGLTAVFNGEGGDQLFGGWTSKPMLAAALYGDFDDAPDPEDEYLRSYHRFYGLEPQLYTPAFDAMVGDTFRRRALLTPYLGSGETSFYLNRVRLADLSLKGSQNILPRAERIANGHALDVRVPLFDRRLAELSFRIPTRHKLHGACEKYVLKLALQGRLPDDVVWRRKFGMSVPVTDWVLGPKGGSGRGPLYARVADVLSESSLNRRGWFQPAYVAGLLEGREAGNETRRRRLGEKLWALFMLESWARRFLDGASP